MLELWDDGFLNNLSISENLEDCGCEGPQSPYILYMYWIYLACEHI